MLGFVRRARIGRLGMAVLAVAACGGLAAAALGAPPSPKRQALLDSTVLFLQENQQDDGGFAAAGEPSQSTSAWVALALAAAGINPRNQAKPCGSDAYGYLAGHFREATAGETASGEQVATTTYERELMVVNASGADPHDFAGVDLVAKILERELADGSFPYTPGDVGRVNTTVFAILALSPVDEPQVESAIAQAAAWLISQQNAAGSWYWAGKSAQSEVDLTGAAIEALNAAGPPATAAERDAFERAQRKGFEYLEASQLDDGGFPAVPAREDESNVASTAWAVQAIWSAGEDAESWRTGSGDPTEEPLDYMESMQQPDGHIRWRRSSDVNGIWMTAYVTPAFAGQALPIPAATYSAASTPPCDGAASGTKGVIAGGGGGGAPLFSRPKPQSRGRTPGGARLLAKRERRTRNHSDSRRGPNAAQPSGTERAEPTATERAENEGREATVGGPAAESGSASGRGGASAGGDEVSGVVIGPRGKGDLAFGAPGLRGASGEDPRPWVAIGIGAAALLAALSGARWERRHAEALP
jgi:prenyltransferase beta subunit